MLLSDKTIAKLATLSSWNYCDADPFNSLAPRHVLYLARKTTGKLADPDLEGIFVVEVGNHGERYYRVATVSTRNDESLGSLAIRKPWSVPDYSQGETIRSDTNQLQC